MNYLLKYVGLAKIGTTRLVLITLAKCLNHLHDIVHFMTKT